MRFGIGASPRVWSGIMAALIATLAGGGPAHADTLVVLQPAGMPGGAMAIADAPGVTASTTAGTSETAWLIEPGSARSQSTAPVPRRLDLYQKINGQLKLVAAVKVRYFADGGEWVPRYRLSEQIYFVPIGGSWKPITFVNGVPSMVNYSSSTLPNAQGYYPSLQFSSTVGPLAIDAWQVQRLTSSLSAPYP